MSQINTISEFMLHAGTDYRVFDLGRAIRPLSSQTFLEIETGYIPAPFPRQQCAWFGILFFKPSQAMQHYIWFVKFPVDEQGLLSNAALQEFLALIVKALSEQQDNHEQALTDNPYRFVPDQQQLADFNSISRVSLNLLPSRFFDAALRYVRQPQSIEWQSLSVQGMADIAAKHHDHDIEALLLENFRLLATEVKQALCCSFENNPVSRKVSQLLFECWHDSSEPLSTIWVLRALTQSCEPDFAQQIITTFVENSQPCEPDLLILIAARHWSILLNKNIRHWFIEQLANAGVDLFTGLFSDLVQLPELRTTMLNVLRGSEKSPALTSAVSHLFKNQSS